MKKVSVSGAGPVGSLLSLFLARRGFEVDAFERRPDMRRERLSTGRSINLAVSTRGLHALRAVGMEEAVLAQAMPMQGRLMHSLTGELAFQPYGKEESDCIYSISRGGLNEALMTAAEATGRVRFHFREPVSNIDEACARNPVFFATDGSSSSLRADFMAKTGGQSSQLVLDYGYKELHLPPTAAGLHQLQKNALHIWPRGTFMLIALPNFDGSFTCTLFLPYESADSSAPTFATLKTATAVEEFFRAQFADVERLLPNLAHEFFENPTGQMVTVKCSPWNYAAGERQGLLVGDAAHAIVPFFGQGMNCGFEDCAILDEMMGPGASWTALFARFSQERKTDADAIADMAAENFVEMRDKVGDARFLLEKQVERALMQRFPDRYVSRYALVTFSRVPYRAALRAGLIQQEILTELCRDLRSVDALDWALAERLLGKLSQ